MKNLNGQILYSEIDSQSNSFVINHTYGEMRSLSNTFTIKSITGSSRTFRPAYVLFRNGNIKVSLGSFRFSNGDIITYSFGFLKKRGRAKIFFHPALSQNLQLFQILYFLQG